MILRTSLALAGALFAAAAAAQTAPVRLPYGAPLDLEDAKAVASAAERAARGIGAQMAVAVVEPSGDIVLAEKMNGTQYASPDIAVAKAKSSARFRRATKEFEDGVPGRAAILGIPGAVPNGGGVLIVRAGRIVGAVGVSGGTSVQDDEVASVAAAALR